MAYYKQLNSIRAVAVILVICFHWIPQSHHFILPLGSWGVEIFFVLSGFLITKILFESRLRAESHNTSKQGVVKNFLLRRSLRIFPLYYLSLIIVLIFDRANVSHLKDNLLYFFGYASNFFFFQTQQFSYPMAHFWSLAVEEQFYIVWPWFILFLPLKYIRHFLLAAIAAGILARVVSGWLYTYDQVTPDVLPLSCFDSFSIGGFFSYLVMHGKKNIDRIKRSINMIGLASFAVMMTLLITKINAVAFLHRTFDSLFFLTIIVNAYVGISGWFGAVANNKVLLYLGQISYGLYIYHLITPWLTAVVLTALSKFRGGFLSSLAREYHSMIWSAKFGLDALILVVVSSASFHFFEAPINKYKHLFR